MTWNIAPGRVFHSTYASTNGRMSVLVGSQQTLLHGNGTSTTRDMIGANADGYGGRASGLNFNEWQASNLQRAHALVAAGDPTPLLTVALATYGHPVSRVISPGDKPLANKLEQLLSEGYSEFKMFGLDKFQARKTDGAGGWKMFNAKFGTEVR
jgi:hypothetical protein